MSNIIGFYGSCPADICMYAACALQNTGRRVCVIDNSDDGVLFRSISASGMPSVPVTFQNVDFMRLEPVVQWHELDYEYVFVQLGVCPPQLCLALCSTRILVVDCDRRNLDYYNQYMQSNSMPACVLLRGFCLSTGFLEKVQRHFEKGNGFIDHWLLLPFHQADEACRLEMQFGSLNQSVQISSDMQKVLGQLFCMVKRAGGEA